MASLKSSWLSIPRRSPFSLSNIPFGIISTNETRARRPAIAIGEVALDLALFSSKGGFFGLPSALPHLDVFTQPTLNAFAALGRPFHREVRNYLQKILADDTPFPTALKTNDTLQQECLIPLSKVQTHLPMHVGDYTDFYAGKNHAFTVGSILRGPQNALQPNYTHLPVGYHGRASSVVVSDTPIRRPCGQILENPKAESKVAVFKACQKLDIELELGAFLCQSNEMGQPVSIKHAEETLFGFVLLNDWSARDIQAWEYVPLGPFNAKNFGTTISPWIVLADALEPFKTTGVRNDHEVLPYLTEEDEANVYDLSLEVDYQTKSGNMTTISRTNSSQLLWSFPQMVAHHSVTGCPLQVGDLLGSGTISGTEAGTYGSLLEGNRNGQEAILLAGGENRMFLEDGDTVVLRGWAGTDADEYSFVGFGDCSGTILPALDISSV